MKSFIASLIAVLCVASASSQSTQNPPQTIANAQTSTLGTNSTATTVTSSSESGSSGAKSTDVLAVTNQTLKVQTTEANAATKIQASTTADLIKSTENAKSASQDLLNLQLDNVTKLTESLTQLQQLYTEGLIARVELEKVQQELADAKLKVTQTQNEIASSTQLAAEIKKASELGKVAQTNKFVKPVLKAINSTGATVMQSTTGSWSIGNLFQVQQFFSQTFGRALPVSTIGQSATHNRMGWDHRNSVDVGIHPDSQEGRALMSYLQMSGIPFLAFRAAVPGVSTGPHIHIGFPSHRLG
jgi:hypothetical protein